MYVCMYVHLVTVVRIPYYDKHMLLCTYIHTYIRTCVCMYVRMYVHCIKWCPFLVRDGMWRLCTSWMSWITWRSSDSSTSTRWAWPSCCCVCQVTNLGLVLKCEAMWYVATYMYAHTYCLHTHVLCCTYVRVYCTCVKSAYVRSIVAWCGCASYGRVCVLRVQPAT